jgi:uncharacterized protein (DUF3820 family)
MMDRVIYFGKYKGKDVRLIPSSYLVWLHNTICPETLGEYYDLFVILRGADHFACTLLKEKIDAQGRDEKVTANNSQMMMLLSVVRGSNER